MKTGDGSGSGGGKQPGAPMGRARLFFVHPLLQHGSCCGDEIT